MCAGAGRSAERRDDQSLRRTTSIGDALPVLYSKYVRRWFLDATRIRDEGTAPLAKVQEAVLEFLRNRDDAALFGAQAVNAYVDEPRMSQDVDILSTRAAEFAEELSTHLAKTFHFAVRVRSVAREKGFRIDQVRQPKNRHLAEVRQIAELPPTQLISEVRANP
jgi:hypothetical protein